MFLSSPTLSRVFSSSSTLIRRRASRSITRKSLISAQTEGRLHGVYWSGDCGLGNHSGGLLSHILLQLGNRGKGRRLGDLGDLAFEIGGLGLRHPERVLLCRETVFEDVELGPGQLKAGQETWMRNLRCVRLPFLGLVGLRPCHRCCCPSVRAGSVKIRQIA